MSKKEKKRFGRCFELSGKFLVSNREWTLVHGVIKDNHFGTNATITHGWCEFEDVVYDSVLESECPKREYYYLYGIVDYEVNPEYELKRIPETLKREYDFEEAAEFMLMTEHFGPWDEELMNHEEKPAPKESFVEY